MPDVFLPCLNKDDDDDDCIRGRGEGGGGRGKATHFETENSAFF